MRIFPFDKRDLIGLALPAILPFVPLVLLVIPLDQLLKQVLKFVF